MKCEGGMQGRAPEGRGGKAAKGTGGGRRVQGRLDENHHLRRQECGVYQMRITLDRGPKFVGERRIIPLRTRDVAEARARRDLVLKVLEMTHSLSHETSVRSDITDRGRVA